MSSARPVESRSVMVPQPSECKTGTCQLRGRQINASYRETPAKGVLGTIASVFSDHLTDIQATAAVETSADKQARIEKFEFDFRSVKSIREYLKTHSAIQDPETNHKYILFTGSGRSGFLFLPNGNPDKAFFVHVHNPDKQLKDLLQTGGTDGFDDAKTITEAARKWSIAYGEFEEQMEKNGISCKTFIIDSYCRQAYGFTHTPDPTKPLSIYHADCYFKLSDQLWEQQSALTNPQKTESRSKLYGDRDPSPTRRHKHNPLTDDPTPTEESAPSKPRVIEGETIKVPGDNHCGYHSIVAGLILHEGSVSDVGQNGPLDAKRLRQMVANEIATNHNSSRSAGKDLRDLIIEAMSQTNPNLAQQWALAPPNTDDTTLFTDASKLKTEFDAFMQELRGNGWAAAPTFYVLSYLLGKRIAVVPYSQTEHPRIFDSGGVGSEHTIYIIHSARRNHFDLFVPESQQSLLAQNRAAILAVYPS